MFDNGDNGPDVGLVWNAIEEAQTIGVDPRIILCIIMQESHGNVGVGTTTDPDTKPTGGLMQAEESPAYPGQHSPNITQVSPTNFAK
jgi:hypothetical protein